MHSHMPVQHLLKQVEISRSQRSQRDVRPDWLTELVNDVAELFEPLVDVGRVGFDCQCSENGWLVGLYLGSTEMVGGKEDGRTRHISFEFDLLGLIERFDAVDEFCWSALPTYADDENSMSRSFVTVVGSVQDKAVRLQIFSAPPEEAGPGLRRYPDGNLKPV